MSRHDPPLWFWFWTAVGAAIWIGLIWIAAHFIIKYW